MGGNFNPLIKYIIVSSRYITMNELMKEEYLEWAVSITRCLITHKIHNLIFELKL